MRPRRQEFSVWRDTWPRDPADGKFVFLARSADTIGRMLFPQDWTGSDPLKTSGEAFHRFKSVQVWIGDAIYRRELSFALRPAKGGEFRLPREKDAWSEFGADDWNVDDFTAIFRTCQMPGSRFAGGPEDEPAPDWIFIDRPALVRMLAAPADRTPKAVSRLAVEKWFIEEMVAPWKNDPAPSNRVSTRDALAMAQGRFPSLSKGAFNEIWGAHRPPEWSTPGPRKSKG